MYFSQKVNLEVLLCLTFNYGHVTCHVTKIENEGNWRVGGQFSALFGQQIGISERG